MGLRQHPGPLAILGFALPISLIAGCTLTPMPGSSFSDYRGPLRADLPTELKLPAREAPSIAAPASPSPSSPTPVQAPVPSPLVLAMQRADSHYERGLQAMRSGNADQAEWEFDAALETLLDVNLNGQSGTRLLGKRQVSAYPPSPWLGALANPTRTLTPEPSAPGSVEESPLEAPALLGPEDVQAVTGTQPEEVRPLPEPDTGKHDIPVVFNDQVKTFIHYFQTRKWGVITRAFERASRYLPMMREIFHEKGLPEDLLNLAFIESAVNPRATSRAKAAGIWQFVPSTGRLYGMRSSWWLDERRDPEKSTRGAAEYLKNLYNMFESWPLALAAYNAGEGKIQAAIQRQRSRNFWSLRLPKETRLFVPAFMAMTIISREPERYGFTPPLEEPIEVETVSLRYPTELTLIAQAARTTIEEIRDLNPELTRWATPPDLSNYTLRIPAGQRDAFLEALERIPPAQRVTWIRHQVRRGETPGGIARRYRMDVRVVLEMNGLRKRQALRPGTTVLLPAAAVGSGVAYATEVKQASRSTTRPISTERYTVKKGDTLAGIGRAHAVSLQELRRWNNLSRDAGLRSGQTLIIHPAPQARMASNSGARPGADSPVVPAAPAAKRYIVKRGDTLWTIARAHAVSPKDLRRWNNLSRDAALRPGQQLQIPAPSS
ncbi:MAG: LysM peptidoglycan-binding domain-containing protein [Candidatus Methylomirabilales bacterium]